MQELTVASVTPKGTGEKTFYVVKVTEGVDLTTFDAAAADWGPGTKLNVEITVKGKHTNIAKWEMVSLVPAGNQPIPTTPSPVTNGYGDDPAKRLSIERQSSAATILQHYAALAGSDPVPLEYAGDVAIAAAKAIAWLSSRFDDTPGATVDTRSITVTRTDPAQQSPPVDQRTQADKDFADLGGENRFKNVGELLAWCGKEGVDRTTFLKIVSAQDTANLNVADAYQMVKDYLAEKGG